VVGMEERVEEEGKEVKEVKEVKERISPHSA
jgi:hypothetical protein